MGRYFYLQLLFISILFLKSYSAQNNDKIKNDDDSIYVNKIFGDCKEIYYNNKLNNDENYKNYIGSLFGTYFNNNNNKDNNNNNNNCKFKKDKNELLKSFKQYFEGFVSFQDDAIKEIESIIYRKYLHPDTKVVMHLFGDHGIGKTLSSKLVSRVLFENGSGLEGDGLLLINGEEFRIIEQQPPTNNNDNNENTKIEDQEYLNIKIQHLRDKLYNTIINKLIECPYSVIVFDEIQKIDPYIISVIEPFLDGATITISDEKKTTTTKINTSLGTYILTSDFDKEGMTYNQSILELKRKATAMFKSIYGDSKFSKLVTESLPFLPLSKSNSKLQIIKEIENSFCRENHLSILSIELKSQVSEIIFQKMNTLYPNENFRAIEKILNYLIFNKVSNFIIQDYDKLIEETKINNNNNDNENEKIQQQNENYKIPFNYVYDSIFKIIKNNKILENKNNHNDEVLITLSIKPNNLNNLLIIDIFPSKNVYKNTN
ncbi:hypothetical protein DDB_G0268156 [Dictyostelium discoideum AX4]|uniref:ATPase AAA-type core domain-containing protein n=1 Tax=Dictyostelium discoideum TaxID=44689 RepID=Q55FE2_DICDI|nr:hypothetical protein DDB_G0268156 [Dictyostelium discoideum AX4]EAL73531.1 hypothetical protein DDB_G0268156 [Dictyostelium discoideum AX4]|eukprot:XP_647591.1 hypothetical protein DDB_G0268156 [Dictyostelium discoideum AX4]